MITAMLLSVTAVADSAGFNRESERVLAAKTAYDSKYTAVSWNTEKAENGGIPLTKGAYVYRPADSRVLKLNEADGSLASELFLPTGISTEHAGVITGNTMVQPLKSGLAIINTTTMTVTDTLTFEGNTSGSCAVIDDLLYASYEENGAETMLCVKLSDGMSVVWEYKSSGSLGDLTRYGNFVLFSEEGGRLISHSLDSDEHSVIDIGEEICGAPFAGEYAVFLTTDDGNAIKLRLNDDGTMEEDTLAKCAVGAHPTEPLSWNDRLYVGSDTGFHILDDLNMEIMRSYDYMAGSTDPIVTLGNGSRVYLVFPENEKWSLYSIYDIDSLEEPQLSKLAILEDFSNGAVCVSENGTMYFRDALGRLYAMTAVSYSPWSMAIRIILVLALVICVFIWLRALRKKKNEKPQY